MKKNKNIESQLLDFVEEAVVVYDSDGFLKYYNNKFKDLYSYTDSDLHLGVHFSELGVIDLRNNNVVITDDFGGKDEYLAIKAEYRKGLSGSFTVQLQDGRFIKTTDRSLPDGGFISVQADVTTFKSIELELKIKNDELEASNSNLLALVNTDTLTGSLSRREIINQTNLRLFNYNSDSATTLICVIDVDDFKKINDEFGHYIGDKALKRVAALRHDFSCIKHFGRLGGDEFLMLVNLLEKNDIIEFFNKISDFLAETSFVVAGEIKNVPITISCGGIKINKNMNSFEDLYNDISQALIVSKSKGKNNFNFIQL